MNTSVYLFGQFNSGYSQYPDDYAQNIFKTFYLNARSITQIAIHRDGNLMYYGYIRKLESNRYIGVCVVVNGAYLVSVNGLFTLFKKTISELIINGWLIHYNEQGEIVSNIDKLYLNRWEIDFVTNYLRSGFNDLKESLRTLPTVSYDKSKDSVAYFNANDDNAKIINSSYSEGYTFIFKDTNYNTRNLDRLENVLHNVIGQRDSLEKELSEKKKEISVLKVKQRNTTWVSFLGVVVFVLGVILWNKVLFPSEVTRYDAGEFTYYGPMANKKPHGVGVAIYPANDKDGRKYYIGNFTEGERQDSTAILFYKDGDYFYGVMEGDEWKEGLFYSRADGVYFEGTFVKNNPYNGEWFDHKMKYRLVNGEEIY